MTQQPSQRLAWSTPAMTQTHVAARANLVVFTPRCIFKLRDGSLEASWFAQRSIRE